MEIPADIKPNDLIAVIWIDAESDPSWINIEISKKPPKARVKTYGEYLYHDEDYLYITWSIGIDGNTDCSRDSIPLGCIKNIKIIGKKA